MTMSNISLHFFPPVSDSSKSPAGWVGPFSLQPARFSEHSACHCHSSKTSFFFFWPCGMQDPSSLNWDQIWALCLRSMGSQPLDRQGSP